MSNITTISYEQIKNSLWAKDEGYIDTIPNFIQNSQYIFPQELIYYGGDRKTLNKIDECVYVEFIQIICQFMSDKQISLFFIFCIEQHFYVLEKFTFGKELQKAILQFKSKLLTKDELNNIIVRFFKINKNHLNNTIDQVIFECINEIFNYYLQVIDNEGWVTHYVEGVLKNIIKLIYCYDFNKILPPNKQDEQALKFDPDYAKLKSAEINEKIRDFFGLSSNTVVEDAFEPNISNSYLLYQKKRENAEKIIWKNTEIVINKQINYLLDLFEKGANFD